MKKTRSLIAAALALVLALSCLPFSVSAKAFTPRWTIPEGYNAHDYNAIVSFLEQADDEGVKNGEKLNANYDPDDPETWGTYKYYIMDTDGNLTACYRPRFQWKTSGNELRIENIFVTNNEDTETWQICGSFDVSGCTALVDLKCSNNALTWLDVSDCSALWSLDCSDNALTKLGISGNTALNALYCSDNALTELSVAGCAALGSLHCDNNNLTELDVSGCTALSALACFYNDLTELDVSSDPALLYLDCYSNALTELDVSSCTELKRLACYNNALTELDVSGCTGLHWLYCENNALTELDISCCTELYSFDSTANELRLLELPRTESILVNTARAEGSGGFGCFLGYYVTLTAYPRTNAEFLGWYNENGELISSSTSYTVWSRNAELIARFTGSAVVPGDMNGDGAVDITDALSVLRAAMGLIEASPEQIAACDMDGDGELTVADALIVMRAAMGLTTLG